MAVASQLPMFIVSFAGAWFGPQLSRYLRERWLKALLALVLFGIALRYFGMV
ncbi:MAG: hypothetical protein HY017_19215 [Betaproteobacteria bacterium]|nr:hypothetical protein [Betaproteobacteria bacterium]